MTIDNDIAAEKLADKLFLDCLGFDCYSNSRFKFSASKNDKTYAFCFDKSFKFLRGCPFWLKDIMNKLFDALASGLTIFVVDWNTGNSIMSFNKNSDVLLQLKFELALEGIEL